MQIAGYDFEQPIRHVKLHNYNPSKNHDKVYHIVLSRSQGGFRVSAMYGRSGSSLRLHTKPSWHFGVEFSAMGVFTNLLQVKMREGYAVQNDESFTLGAPVYDEIEIVSGAPTSAWSHRAYAENPVRATAVNQDFDLSGYGIVLLSSGKRILTLVENNIKKFFDQHGAEITIDQGMFNAVCDLEGDAIIDGVWDGDRYSVFDMPSEQEYAERIQSLAKYIDGQVDENVVQMADVYLTAAESKKAVDDARDLGAKVILGINMSGAECPGQNNKSRVTLILRPRAVLHVIAANGNVARFGVDDGLGIIEVCRMTTRHELQSGDSVLVEYDSWAGHGSELRNPKYIKRANQHADYSIDQLLAV